MRCVVTSPPYALQRSGAQSPGAVLYAGIPEEKYPDWTVSWMEALKPALADDGSVLIVIRPHLRKGMLSDYVYKTILAVREAGWVECEKLIWYKPDAPPLGSILRPRRAYEEILWFSKTNKPFVDLFACGNADSVRTGGFAGSDRFGTGAVLNGGQKRGKLKKGTSRVTDVFQANVGLIDRGVMHPAMYPRLLPEMLIRTFSEPGDVVADPFTGSGQTAIAAHDTDRNYFGCDLNPDYVEMASMRVEEAKRRREEATRKLAE